MFAYMAKERRIAVRVSDVQAATFEKARREMENATGESLSLSEAVCRLAWERAPEIIGKKSGSG